MNSQNKVKKGDNKGYVEGVNLRAMRCTIISICIVAIVFLVCMPEIKQSASMFFSQDSTGQYQIGGYFNIHKFDQNSCESMLAKTAITDQNESSNKIANEIISLCNILSNQESSAGSLKFQRETYKITLSMTLIQAEMELIQDSNKPKVISVKVIVIDKEGLILTVNKPIKAISQRNNRNSWMNEGNQINIFDSKIILYDKLQNAKIDIQGLIVIVEQPGIVVESAQIDLDVSLSGIRYVLSKYKYSASAALVGILSSTMFIITTIVLNIKSLKKNKKEI